MKRPSLKSAIEWIAFNDDWDPKTVPEVAEMISVVLTADLFGVTPEVVATRVLLLRHARYEEEPK